MINYKYNSTGESPNSKLLTFRDECESEKSKKELIINYSSDFDHYAFQDAISKGNTSDICSFLSKFRSFYIEYKFKPSEISISSIRAILSILSHRNPDIKELIESSFDALNCLFLSKIEPLILINENVLDILHPYLTDPQKYDIIPSLKVIKYLAASNECETIFNHFNISIFKNILMKFDHRKIDKTTKTILVCYFKNIERIRNNEKIELENYLKEINELFNSTFYVLNKEIRKFINNSKNHKCSIMSLYLDLLYKLIQNNEGYCPNLNSNLMGNSMTPIFFFNTILHECDFVKPVTLTLKILIEIIHNHFKYFNYDATKRIQFFLKVSPSEIQSLAIMYFFTLIQIITNGSISINQEQIEEFKNLFSELDLYSNLIDLVKTRDLFFNSINYSIQSLDILFDFLNDDNLLSLYNSEIVEQLCLLIAGEVKTETLDSIINIFYKLLDFLTATNIEKRDLFVQELTNDLDQETIECVLKSEKIDLARKAQSFFDQIQDLVSLNSND